MDKRVAAALIAFLFAFLLLMGAVAEQPVLNWESGTLYFHDTGIEPGQRVLVLQGYQGSPEALQYLGKRTLQPHEYTWIDAPEGIVGCDIQFDSAFNVMQYDFIEISIEEAATGGTRERFATANGFQFVPDALYLYRLQTSGVIERSIEVAGSFVVNPLVKSHTHYMFMQTVGSLNHAGHRLGMDDSDTFFFVSGHRIHFSFNRWAPTSSQPGDLAHMYYLEEDLSALGMGESVTLPLFDLPGGSSSVTVTITKEAVLRGNPPGDSLADGGVEPAPSRDATFPDPIQWPANAVGQIVVLKDGTFVRQGGSTNYNRVGKVNGGDIFFVIGRFASGWYAFEWTDGQTVYIAPSRVEFTLRER